MQKAHFIGIAGVGMSATAKILQELGWEISGSDEGLYPPMSEYLEKWGIPCTARYSPENIPRDADIIVIGKHAKLVPEENKEVAAALASGKPIRSFPEVLEDIVKGRENIVVAGSYGKSTCTALVAWCLRTAGGDPGYFIGAIPRGFPSHGHTGKDNTMILEGDEYPASNWNARSKFLFMHPETLLLTSLMHDHINIFPTFEDYLKPFRELVMSVPKHGLFVVHNGYSSMRELLDISPAQTVTYSLDGESEWSARDMKFGERSSFTLLRKKKKIVDIETSLLGKHNIENIVGAAAVLLSRELISPEEFAKGIASFQGIVRRLDKKTENSLIPVYEGFGSSYDKARSAIEAIKLHYPDRKLFIIFEPHTFSWRNADTIHWYDTVFKEGDRVIVYKPPTHGSDTHKQLSLSQIVDRIKNAGLRVSGIEREEEGLEILKNELGQDAVVLLLTSGDLGGLIEQTTEFAIRAFPSRK